VDLLGAVGWPLRLAIVGLKWIHYSAVVVVLLAMLTIEFAVAAMYMDSVACRGVVVEGTKNEERKSSTLVQPLFGRSTQSRGVVGVSTNLQIL